MDDAVVAENSELHVLVPQFTERDTGQLFNDIEIPPNIQQRSLLYFDELLEVYLVLQTPFQEETDLETLFSRLNISLQARAFGSVVPSSSSQDASANSSPSRVEDIIWSGTIDTSEDPIVVVRESSRQDITHYLHAIWSTTVLLNRPRLRLQTPMITFRASVALRPLQTPGDDLIYDPYLPSGIPAPMNILEPLKDSHDSQEREPRLLASRLAGTQSVRQRPQTSLQILKTKASNSFRALPAIASRVRYHNSATKFDKATLIASLDLECAPFSDDNMRISDVDMQLSEGTVEDLTASHFPLLPLTCRPRDSTVFLFRLLLSNSLSEPLGSNSSRTVEIDVKATVLISDDCRPKIHMRWRTGVDVTTALNPSYSAPGQSMQRSKRPANLPVVPSSEDVDKLPVMARDDDDKATREGSKTRQRAISISDLGVTITFTAPKQIWVGKEFAMDALVLNGSRRPRKLALRALTRHEKADSKGHLPKSSPLSADGRLNPNIAEAVVDENLLYAMQKSSLEDSAQIISMSTDVKIGPLNPGCCANAELKFIALQKGYLQLEAIQVVDVVSTDSVYIQDLPDIIAEDETH